MILAQGLSMRGHRVLAIDIDPQGSLTTLHGILPETVERTDHPWFIGVQYHPELKSRPFAPHPLFAGFIAAAMVQSRLV